MTTMVDITGVDRVRLLCALFNSAKAQGFEARMNPALAARNLTVEEMRQLLPGLMEVSERHAAVWGVPVLGYKVEYLHGRVLKVDIPLESHGDEFDAGLYDRDNGEGLAQMVVNQVRETGSVAPVIA